MIVPLYFISFFGRTQNWRFTIDMTIEYLQHGLEAHVLSESLDDVFVAMSMKIPFIENQCLYQ